MQDSSLGYHFRCECLQLVSMVGDVCYKAHQENEGSDVQHVAVQFIVSVVQAKSNIASDCQVEYTL